MNMILIEFFNFLKVSEKLNEKKSCVHTFLFQTVLFESVESLKLILYFKKLEIIIINSSICIDISFAT